MNRLEKKRVRLNMIQILDTRCKGCMMRNDYDAHNYCIKHCEVSQELQHLSSQLVKKNELVQGSKWTKDEELYLINHMSLYTIDHMAHQLNRSPQSVISKIQRIGLKKSDFGMKGGGLDAV